MTLDVAQLFAPATATQLGGVKQGSGILIDPDGTINVTSGGVGTVTSITAGVGLGAPNTGNAITTAGTINLLPATALTLGGVKQGSGVTITGDGTINATGGAVPSRVTTSATTGSLSVGASADFTIVGFKSYALLKIQMSAAGWLRLYTDAASRTADSSRVQGVDPAPDAGVIAEIIPTTAATIKMSPGVIGWNNDTPAATTIYARVTNTGISSHTYTITLSIVKMEE